MSEKQETTAPPEHLQVVLKKRMRSLDGMLRFDNRDDLRLGDPSEMAIYYMPEVLHEFMGRPEKITVIVHPGDLEIEQAAQARLENVKERAKKAKDAENAGPKPLGVIYE